jgi:protein translocase SecG subunit
MNIIETLQVVVSVFLVISILMQNRGSSLGGGFGGDSFASYHTQRGFEVFLTRSSIFLAVSFLALSLASVWLG